MRRTVDGSDATFLREPLIRAGVGGGHPSFITRVRLVGSSLGSIATSDSVITASPKIYSHPLSTPQNPRRAGELDRRGANVEARPAILLVESRAAFSTGPALPTSEAHIPARRRAMFIRWAQ